MSQTLLEVPHAAVVAPGKVQVETAPAHFQLSTLTIPPSPANHGSGRTLGTEVVEEDQLIVSKSRTAAVFTSITCITAMGSLLNGLLTVCIPVIAEQLNIPDSLQLWPISIFALTCGCTLLLCGSAADVLGCRRMCLIGTLLQSAFTLGCGLSTDATQMIVFRGLAGVAASFCLPSAVSIVTSTFPHGPRRNIAFATMGGGQPFGFGLGLVLGGVFADTIGWRWAFYTTTIVNSAVFALAIWVLPSSIDTPLTSSTLTHLAHDIDWVGAVIISASLAGLSYVFAAITGSTHSIREPLNIALLAASLALLPAFVYWMHRQVARSKPALIPNALWRNTPFTAICLTVALVWGAFNAVEQFTAFYLEYVREIPALQSSVSPNPSSSTPSATNTDEPPQLYFLPAPIAGALVNAAIGVLLPHLRPALAVPAGCFAAALAPLVLAACCGVDGPGYWRAVFPAMALNPVGPDVIYTIANLVVTAAFPGEMQGVAGGVFNTVAQIGKSVGLATTAVIAARVAGGDAGREALLEGYKAGWWYCCGLGLVTVGVSAWGLRRVGKVGVKRE